MSFLIVGDSHVELLGPALAKVLPNTTIVAKRGYSTADMVKANLNFNVLLGSLTGNDWIIFPLGTNDAAKGLSPAAQTAAIKTLVTKAKATGAQVIWLGPPTVTKVDLLPKVRAVAGLQSQLMPTLGVRWYNSLPLTIAGPFQSDGIHQTAKGYANWAALVAPRIAKAAGIASPSVEPPTPVTPYVAPPLPPAPPPKAPPATPPLNQGLVVGIAVTSMIVLSAMLGMRDA